MSDEQRASGDPVNPERMWIGFALLAASVAIGVLAYRDEEAARAIGAGFAPVVLGLVIALVIRLIWARGKTAKAFEISGFILCMGIAAVICGALGFLGQVDEKSDREQAQEALDQLENDVIP